MFLLSVCFLPLFTACGKYDYSKHIAEQKSDIFCAKTEEFELTLSCISREYPYAQDGVAATKSDIVEVSLLPSNTASETYIISIAGDENFGGETSFRNARGDYFFSQGVKTFPKESVTVTVQWGEESRELVATSVKTEKTLSVKEALNCAILAEKEYIDGLRQNNVFCGEFHVRLLQREKTYYYVGILDKTGKTLALLLDSESGEVLAKRISG